MYENKIVGWLSVGDSGGGEVIVTTKNMSKEGEESPQISLSFVAKEKKVTIYISYEDLERIKKLPTE